MAMMIESALLPPPVVRGHDVLLVESRQIELTASEDEEDSWCATETIYLCEDPDNPVESLHEFQEETTGWACMDLAFLPHEPLRCLQERVCQAHASLWAASPPTKQPEYTLVYPKNGAPARPKRTGSFVWEQAKKKLGSVATATTVDTGLSESDRNAMQHLSSLSLSDDSVDDPAEGFEVEAGKVLLDRAREESGKPGLSPYTGCFWGYFVDSGEEPEREPPVFEVPCRRFLAKEITATSTRS